MPATSDTGWGWVLGLGLAGIGLAGLAAMVLGDDDDTPVTGPRCKPRLPCGKGLFVRSPWSHGGPVDLFVQRMQWYGVRWVMLQCMWQQADGQVFRNDPVRLGEYAAACRDAGIGVWLFGWPRPEPEKRREFLEQCMRAAATTAPIGLVINPEKPWYRKHDEAAAFMAELRGAFPGMSIGMTSFGGGPQNHPTFPWVEFAAADFGIPQIYDTHHTLSRDAPERFVRYWTNAGYRCVPALAAGKAHTPEQMRDIAQRTPVPNGAICWWDLYWLLHATNADTGSTPKGRSQVVRDYVVPGGPGPVVA